MGRRIKKLEDRVHESFSNDSDDGSDDSDEDRNRHIPDRYMPLLSLGNKVSGGFHNSKA